MTPDASGLVVSVQFITGTYDAGTQSNQPEAEWPPHPARLFCALVAALGSSRGGPEEAALRWLETQDPPVIGCSEAQANTNESMQPTNGPNDRSNLAKKQRLSRSWMTLADPVITFWWAGPPPPAVVDGVDSLARRMPYLGRSTSPVSVSVAVGPQPTSAQIWTEGGDGDDELRAPRPGYLDELTDMHAAGEPAHRAPARLVRYRDQVRPFDPGLWGEFRTFRLQPALPHAWALRVAEAARASVLGVLPPGDRLAGHQRNEPHPAFLPLPVVGSTHADGMIRGLGVAVPASYAEADHERMRAALASLCRPGWQLFLRGGGVLAVTPSVEDDPWATRPSRWRRPSTRWASATPVMLDRWPRKGHPEDALAILWQSIRGSGYPTPASIEVFDAPITQGSGLVPQALLARQGKGPRPHRPVFCRVRFEAPVRGPVVLGALRSFGLGLCIPEPERA